MTAEGGLTAEQMAVLRKVAWVNDTFLTGAALRGRDVTVAYDLGPMLEEDRSGGWDPEFWVTDRGRAALPEGPVSGCGGGGFGL